MQSEPDNRPNRTGPRSGGTALQGTDPELQALLRQSPGAPSCTGTPIGVSVLGDDPSRSHAERPGRGHTGRLPADAVAILNRPGWPSSAPVSRGARRGRRLRRRYARPRRDPHFSSAALGGRAETHKPRMRVEKPVAIILAILREHHGNSRMMTIQNCAPTRVTREWCVPVCGVGVAPL
jgi:hypothetical protein